MVKSGDIIEKPLSKGGEDRILVRVADHHEHRLEKFTYCSNDSMVPGTI